MKIKNLKDNVLNQITLLVVKVDFKISKKQEDYAKVTFSDGKTQIPAFIWNINKEKFAINVGCVYDVFAYSQEFNSKPVLKIVEINVIDDQSILNDFVKTAVIPTSQIKEYISSQINLISDKTLQKLTLDIVSNEKNYFNAPAAANNHHAYLTGMSYHVYNMLHLVHLFDLTTLEKDILISGIILHDIGKCYELKNDLVVKYTTTGYLLGHLAIGYEIVYKYKTQNNINSENVDDVLNLILAHHGKIEYGNLKRCETKVEKIINLIDTIDAYLNAFIEKLESISIDSWSDNVYALNNRKVYKQKLNSLELNTNVETSNKLNAFVDIYTNRYVDINKQLIELAYEYTQLDFPHSFNKLIEDESKFNDNFDFYQSLKHLVLTDIEIDELNPLTSKIIEGEILKWFKNIEDFNKK